MADLLARYQHLRGTASEHATANNVLRDGEISVESDTGFLKLGDGATPWNNLPYVTGATIPWASLSELKAGGPAQKAIDAAVGTGYLVREPTFTQEQAVTGPSQFAGRLRIIQAPRAGSEGNTDAMNKLAVAAEIAATLAGDVGQGSADANKAPRLGATGVLDPSFLPSNLSNLDYRGVFDPTAADGDGGNGALQLRDIAGGGITPSATDGSYVQTGVNGFWDFAAGAPHAGPAGGSVKTANVQDTFTFKNNAWGRVAVSSIGNATFLQVSGANTMDGDLSFSAGTRKVRFQSSGGSVEGQDITNLAALRYFSIDCGSY